MTAYLIINIALGLIGVLMSIYDAGRAPFLRIESKVGNVWGAIIGSVFVAWALYLLIAQTPKEVDANWVFFAALTWAVAAGVVQLAARIRRINDYERFMDYWRRMDRDERRKVIIYLRSEEELPD